RYTEVTLWERLAYVTIVDFVPDAAAYELGVVVEFRAMGDEVRVKLTSEVMHNREWTRRALMGWSSQFDRLRQLIEAGGTRSKGSPAAPRRTPAKRSRGV
ncbi:MAG: hypothetical protein L3J96_05435, partial [Thermoplasmata archaeon]|nr:hypothetical protein [Thermoplasmata archaeon]